MTAGVGEVVTLVAPAGAGKSWWWKALGAYADHQVLSLDRFRLVLTDNAASMDINPVAVELRRAVLEHRLRRGLPTLVDSTNTVLDHRGPILAVARKYSRPVVAVVFHTPVEVCVQRQSFPERTQRRPGQPYGRAVPEAKVRQMFADVAGVWDRMHLEADCVVHVAPDGKSWVRVGDLPRPAEVRIPWLEATPAIPGVGELPWRSPYATAAAS